MDLTALIFNVLSGTLTLAALFYLRSPARGAFVPVTVATLANAILVLFLGSFGFRNLFGIMQLASWALFVQLPLGLLGLAFVRRQSKPLVAAALGLTAVLVGIGIDAFLVEPRSLDTSHFEIKSAKVTRPFRIAHISDFQTDHIGEWERYVLDEAMASNPDMVVLTGDYVQGEREIHDVQAPIFHALIEEKRLSRGRLGAYAVKGNVEWPDWETLFLDTGVQATSRTRTSVNDGVAITALSFDDGFDTHARVEARPEFHIAIAHAPDFALGEIGADLLLAGHTHGGQVQIPGIGPLMKLSKVPRAWAAGGRTDLEGGRTLIVSRGLGMERGNAPRLRFRCRPQLVIIDVVPSAPEAVNPV